MNNSMRQIRLKDSVKSIKLQGPVSCLTPRKPLSSKRDSFPYLELVLNPSPLDYRLYAAPANPYPQYAEPNNSYIQIASCVTHPFSSGSIHINTSDPTAYPEIDINAWSFEIGEYTYPFFTFCTDLLACEL